MKKVYITTSWDDGHPQDLKLAELLTKYDIPATFYVPVNNSERKVMSEKEIHRLSKNFEIGGHTLNHKDLTSLSLTDAEKEIARGKSKLENIISRKVESFAYPDGKYNQNVKQLVGLSGFKCARTIKLFKKTVVDKLLAPTTVHAYDHHPLVYLSELKPEALFKSWNELAVYFLEYCLENGGVFHLWGHSWEIDERGDWKRLEKVLRQINKVTPKKTRLTNGELIGALEKRKREYYLNIKPERYRQKLQSSYHQSELDFLRKKTKGYDNKGKRVLDIGCGIGRISKVFEKADYIGVDFAGNLINYAKKTYPDKRFLVGEFEKLNFTEATWGKYDLILIWGLFEDETSPFSALSEVGNYIKRGTRIIFTLHNQDSLKFRMLSRIKTSYLTQSFPYTSFTSKVVERKAKAYSEKHGFRYRVLILGPSLVVILDKK